MCCTWLTENTRCIKSPEIRHLDTITQLCRAVSLQLRHVSTIGKKLVKQQYLLHMSSQYGKLRPTNGWDRFRSLGQPRNSNGFCVLTSLMQRYRSPQASQTWNFARCLAVSWASTLYIHFQGLLPPDRVLFGAKFTLCPSLAFSYIGIVTARRFSSRHQPNFAAWYKEWNYEAFTEGATYIRLDGHHVGHRPTF